VEVIVRFPLALPADCGVKVTVKVALSPAARVTGWLRPLTLNPVPVTEGETVTGRSTASLVIAKLPVVPGVKLMLKATFFPMTPVTGGAECARERRIMENMFAVESALATVAAALLLLVAVAIKVLLVPTGTLPKLTMPFDVGGCCEATLMP